MSLAAALRRVAALLVLAALLGSPVSAQHDEWACGTADGGPAPSLTSNFQRGDPVTVPMVFHIVHGRDSTGAIVGDITDAMIQLQVDSLNQGFAGTDISFSLLGISRLENQYWFERMYERFDNAAEYLHVDPLHVMNIYVGQHPGIGGAASFYPDNGSVGAPDDGLFINWRNFPGSASVNFSEGDTGVHESGHYFGLRHTFDGGCVAPGDGIDDTPYQGDNTVGCPVERDTCPDLPGLDPIHNYMDYSDDVCKFEFTPNQNDVQKMIQEEYRGDIGLVVPTVYDSRSAPVTFDHPTFSGEYVYVLPGADVTVTGTVTLLNGARFVAAGGTDLGGVTGLDLQDGSVFDIRGYGTPLTFTGDVTVRGGSTLRLGRQLVYLHHLGAPDLFVEGDVTVADEGSALEVGRSGMLRLGASSVARFDDGGLYRTSGGTTVGSRGQFVFESDAAAPVIDTRFADPTFALGGTAELVFRNGGYVFGGLSEFYPFAVRRLHENESWNRVVFEGDDVFLSYARIEGGKTGALVRARDVEFYFVTLTGNDMGLRTEYAASATTGRKVRSTLSLLQNRIADNAVAGLYVRNADVTVASSTVERNLQYGVYVSNATLNLYPDNLVTTSGVDASGSLAPSASGDGIRIGTDGEVYLSDVLGRGPGVNRIANNAEDEIEVAKGAYLFVGTQINGDNAIFKSGSLAPGRYLIENHSKYVTLAQNTYWGSPDGPPRDAFQYEPYIDYEPFLDTDLSGGAGARPARADETVVAAREASPATGNRGVSEVLAEHLRQLRQQVEHAPAHALTLGRLQRLYALQRLDRDDELGEYAATMTLLGRFREVLGQDGLPATIQPSAEYALCAEVADALRNEDYDGAEALLNEHLVLVEGEEARSTLFLSAAALDEQRAQYPEAIAKIDEVIAALPPESEDLAAGLTREIAMIEELMAEGGAGRPSGGASESVTEARSRAGVLPMTFALGAAYPNPFDAATVIPFEVAERAEVRLVVVDLLGREVAVLSSGLHEAGRYRARFDGRGLASGVYVLRAVMAPAAGGPPRVFSQKLTVLR